MDGGRDWNCRMKWRFWEKGVEGGNMGRDNNN